MNDDTGYEQHSHSKHRSEQLQKDDESGSRWFLLFLLVVIAVFVVLFIL
ncbi:hypothetical protein [Halorarum halobium]|nr:hypothetical protein [Halobaculum sp. XH14]